MRASLFLGLVLSSQIALGQGIDLDNFVSAPLYNCARPFAPLRENKAAVSVAHFHLTDYERKLVDLVEKALQQAAAENHPYDEVFKQLHGMSSIAGRRLMNGLLRSNELKFRYLEIGSWKGSTFVSALYGNENSVSWAMSIDNHSEFTEGAKEPIGEVFNQNCADFLQPLLENGVLHQLNLDSFAIEPTEYIPPGSVDVYFYDGHHSAQSQEKAFVHYDSVLSETFIAIVDDWLNPKVRNGTYVAFRKLGYQVVYEVSVPVSSTNTVIGNPSFWWQGTYIAVIRKSRR